VSKKVLIVDDEPHILMLLEQTLDELEDAGVEIIQATDGGAALKTIREQRPDLVLLDVMMPHVDGIEACKRIRASGDTIPILMLTAKTAVDDRVEGLDAGADDYLMKPFALNELLARIRALLRRSMGDVSQVIRYQDLVIDPGARTVTRGDESIFLTKTEFDLLVLLAHTPGIVLERDTIYEEIWGIDFQTSSNSLDVYVGYLRRKLEVDDAPRLIHTVRGVGYVLRTDG